MNKRSYLGLFWVLVVLGTVADQTSKYGVYAWRYPTEPAMVDQEWPVFEGSFGFFPRYVPNPDGTYRPDVNHGAVFGLGHRKNSLLYPVFNTVGSWFGADAAQTANGVFAAISFLAGGAIVIWVIFKGAKKDLVLAGSLGLILGGTIGNLYDRLIFGGVRDFLYYHGLFEWPVFNVADCCLVVGAFLLLVQAFWSKPVSVPKQESEVALAEHTAE